MKAKILGLLLIASLLAIGPGCGGEQPVCTIDQLREVNLLSPAFYSTVKYTGTQPTLTWEYPKTPSGYYPDGTFYSGINCHPEKYRVTLRTGPYFTDDLGGTTTSSVPAWTPSTPLETGKQYAWGVEAMVGDVAGPFTGYWYFFYGSPCFFPELLAPTLLEPANGAVLTDNWPELFWEHTTICLPDTFNIWFSTNADFSEPSIDGYIGYPAESWTPPYPLDDCETYYWKVAPVYGDTMNFESATFQFKIDMNGTCSAFDWHDFYFEAVAPCNIGPGPEFDTLAMLQPGDVLPAEGRNEAGDWLLLMNQGPESTQPANRCWVGPGAGRFEGNRMDLPVISTGPLPPLEGPTPIPGSCNFTFLMPGNCRAGPGVAYSILASEEPGTMAPVLGRNPEANWYKIQLPSVACWVAAKIGTINCDARGLKILEIPPTPVPYVPGGGDENAPPAGVPSCSSYSVGDCPNWCQVIPDRLKQYICADK